MPEHLTTLLHDSVDELTIPHADPHAIAARDVPMLQGTALSLGLIFVALNAFADVAILAVDPRRRIHHQRLGRRQLGLHDRRHQLGAQHRDPGADAETGQHVAGVVRPGVDPGQADQARQPAQHQTGRGALQPDAERERRGAGRMPGRERVRLWVAVDAAPQRHRVVAGPVPAPQPLGALVGDQAGDTEGDQAADRAPAQRRAAGGEQARGDGHPQLGVVGGAGQRRQHRIQQGSVGAGDGVENFLVQGSQTPGDLLHSSAGH